MPRKDAFFSMHRHGFVRVAACTPRSPSATPRQRRRDARADARGRRAARRPDAVPGARARAYAIDDLLLQDALLKRVEAALARLVEASRALRPVVLVGAPVRRNGRLYNCAVAISRGRILGVVPKTFLPNYREYYEKRWFAPGLRRHRPRCELAGQTVPFGTDLCSRPPTCPTSSSTSRSARTSGPPIRHRRSARSPAR